MEINGRLIVKGAAVPTVRNVLSHGATGDGSTDDYSAILEAYNSLPATGGIIFFPAGVYYVSETIIVSRSNVTLMGEGPGATEIKSTGDYAVISIEGVENGDINRGGVVSMTIRGGGKDNLSAHGIQTDWTNRTLFSDLVFHACRHAFDIKDAWQVKIRDCDIYGQGSDQNHIGLYGQISENSATNNSLVVNNLNVQSTASHGVRMESFAGSKFVNCESGTTGGKGFFFGAPSSGSVYCKFLHVANCLADTCTEEAWYFDGTGAYSNIIQDIQLANIWAGSAVEGIHIEEGLNFTITNVLIETHSKHGIGLYGSDRIDIHGGYFDNYDSGDTGTGSGVYLSDSDKCLVSGANFVSSGADKAIKEVGTSDENRFIGNHTTAGGGITAIGVSTINEHNIT